MGVRTGRPRGRPAGSRNKHTIEREARLEEARKAAAATMPAAFQGDAHALLVSVYANTALDLSLRIDAAKAAIRYEKPALSSVQAAVALTVEEMTEEQLDDAIARDAAAAGLLAH